MLGLRGASARPAQVNAEAGPSRSAPTSDSPLSDNVGSLGESQAGGAVVAGSDTGSFISKMMADKWANLYSLDI